MRIIQLQAENFKRLKAVDIKPNGDVVNISGRNGQGKSSIIDAMWAALGGVENMPAEPVRKGSEKAIIRLDLGDYIVTRKMTQKDGEPFTTTLVVETPDGMKASKPQALLNGLLGKFSLDPMAFIRMSPKEQFDALKFLVPGLDLDDIKKKDVHDYELRTVENRKAKEARAAAGAIDAKDKPAVRVDTAQITADIGRASEHNQAIAERKTRREQAASQVVSADKAIANLRGQINTWTDLILDAETQIESHQKIANETQAKLLAAPTLPEPLDTAKLAQALADANAANAEAEKQERRDELLQTATRHEKAAEALTEAIEAREEHKRTAIAAAKFPVEGLSLGEESVLIDGVPFGQAATSQKIKTSVSLAMAMNPDIRVIRIEEGSLLDSDALKVIADMAKGSDFQVWVESVSDGTGSGIIIEDGQIKGE